MKTDNCSSRGYYHSVISDLVNVMSSYPSQSIDIPYCRCHIKLESIEEDIIVKQSDTRRE